MENVTLKRNVKVWQFNGQEELPADCYRSLPEVERSLSKDLIYFTFPTFRPSYRRMIGDVTTPPTVQVGAGAGTGASATLDANANDDGFIITLVTGSVGTPTANSIQCTVTFGIPFAAAPSKVFSPANAAAALLTGVTALFGAATTTVFTLTSGPTALPNGTTLKFAVK